MSRKKDKEPVYAFNQRPESSRPEPEAEATGKRRLRPKRRRRPRRTAESASARRLHRNNPAARRFVVALAIVVAMSIAVACGFKSILSSWSFLTPLLLGAFGAAAVGLLAWRWRFLIGESVAVSVLAFFVLGGFASGGLPTPGAYSDFFQGLVHGWADLLSSAPPADLTPEFRAVPYTAAWISTAVGAEILRHTKRPTLPALGPLLGFLLTLLFVIENRRIAGAQGAVLVAGTIAFGVLGQRALTADRTIEALDVVDDSPRTARRRVVLGAVLAAATVIGAPLIGPRLPLADAEERFDLREYQVPPFNPLNLASPLSDVKKFLVDANNQPNNATVFIVESATPVTRWPMAVMTDFNGIVWTVADAEEAETAFVPVDRILPELDLTGQGVTDTVEATVQIENLGGVFLPLPGVPTEIEFADGDRDVRLNVATGTVALPGRISQGLTYEIDAQVPRPLSDEQTAGLVIESRDLTPEEERFYPQPLRNFVSDQVAGQPTEWDEIDAIRDFLVTSGGYDVSDQTLPGSSMRRIQTMLSADLPTGFEEQFAAAAGVMLRIDGIASRVVVGFLVPPDRYVNGRAEFKASDMSAWVEVDTGDQYGWVPIDVTAEQAVPPDSKNQRPQERPVVIPNPPPDPPTPPIRRPPTQIAEESDEQFTPLVFELPEVTGGWSTGQVVAVSATGGPILLIAAIVGFVALAKARRRRRRRRDPDPGRRVVGAFAEVVDRARDAGTPPVPRATTQERIATYLALDERLGAVESDLWRLGADVDRSTFGAAPPDPARADEAWAHAERVIEEMRRQRSGWARLRMTVSPRSLRRDPVSSGGE